MSAHWSQAIGFTFALAFFLGTAAGAPVALAGSPAPGCGCDLETYQRELALIETTLHETMNGTNGEAQATRWAWGINPCRAGPLSTPTRYAFDLLSEDKNKCHDHCSTTPWYFGKDSWDLCLKGGRSFCTSKYGNSAAGQPGRNCIAHGTNIEACEADPNCQPVLAIKSTEDKCHEQPHHVLQDGYCMFDMCSRLESCSPHWALSCKVNCNDCQTLTVSALRHLQLQCFTAQNLESYYIHGNYGRQNGFGHLTAGTHSLVKLVPTPGSFAELVSPLGLVGDALEAVQLRRITATQAISGGLSVDREAVTLTPAGRDNFLTPLELMPHTLAVATADDSQLSSGCPVSLPVSSSDRARAVQGLSNGLQAYYGLLQRDYCAGDSGAATDRDRVMARIRSQTGRYSESMAAE